MCVCVCVCVCVCAPVMLSSLTYRFFSFSFLFWWWGGGGGGGGRRDNLFVLRLLLFLEGYLRRLVCVKLATAMKRQLFLLCFHTHKSAVYVAYAGFQWSRPLVSTDVKRHRTSKPNERRESQQVTLDLLTQHSAPTRFAKLITIHLCVVRAQDLCQSLSLYIFLWSELRTCVKV